jgi:protein-disulfide isomerase
VGGAERADRRRRQQATQAVRSARADAGTDGRRTVILAMVVVAVLAAAVIGGVLWQRSRSAPAVLTPVQVAASYPVQVDGGVVVAGRSEAGVTVDVYEDLLCPACRAFEERDRAKIEQALEAGTMRARYHLLNLLDDRSNPPGYSLDAAAATLCAAEAGVFPSYHASLFAHQPQEGGRGYSVDQLVQLGRDLGITDAAFEPCVRSGTHKDEVRAQLAAASADPALRHPGPDGGQYFGTPTAVVNGKVVGLANPTWLDDAISAG